MFDVVKQIVFNNAVHGEQKRRRSEKLGVVSFPEAVLPNPKYVLGVDVSDWDGEVNMKAAAQSGVKFAIIKAIDGVVASKYWLANRSRAMAESIVVGEYGWLYPNRNVSCKAQAQKFWSVREKLVRQLPAVIDFEWTKYAGKQSNPNYDDLYVWAYEYNRVADRKPILYSAAGYMNEFGRMPDSLRSMFSGFWFANYNVEKPLLPLGFTSWDFWQFTDNLPAQVYVPGNAGKIEADGDYWKGDLASLLAFAQVGQVPPTPDRPRLSIRLSRGSLILLEEEIDDD